MNTKFWGCAAQFRLVAVCMIVTFTSSSSGECEIMDTTEEFKKLDFTVPNDTTLWLWESSMERRYLDGLNKWKDNPLKVLIIPFSHVDAFWVRTFEEYYHTKTKHILDNLVNVMPKLPKMKFVWSDIFFLQYWWDRAPEISKEIFKDLVRSRRVEIVTGGWVMPDEAVTTLYALISQLIEGHEWLNDNLGILPQTSWSIDPFGLSSTMPYLLAASGVGDGLLIQRTHYAWKRHFARRGISEMKWRPSWDDSGQWDMKLRVQHSSTYVISDTCGPATSICNSYDFGQQAFDLKYADIRGRVEVLLGQYGRLGSLSRKNLVAVPLGGDFRFSNSTEWTRQYENYNAIMDFVNHNHELYQAHIKFATLKEFFDQVDETQMEVKLQGDFFPYSDYSNKCRNRRNCRVTDAYWTGYYSTRPRLKLLSNIVESSLRAVEILFTLGAASWLADCSKTPESLQWAQEARRKMVWARRTWSTFQHHDGITGTSTARVMRQQTRRLKRSGRYLRDILEGLVSRFLDFIKPFSDQKIHLRESATSRKAKIVIFNPSEYERKDLLAVQKLRDTKGLEISDGGQTVIHQLGNKLEDLVYFRVPVPPLSLKIIEIVERTSNATTCLQEAASIVSSNINLSNNVVNLTFERNLLTSMTSKNYNSNLRIRIGTYDLYPGLNGAYLFKPRPKIDYLNASEDSKYNAGSIFKEVVTKFESVNLTIRLLNEEEEPIIHLFVEYLLEQENKELFLEIGADISSDTWKTDVNGFEVRERKNVKTEGLEANVYPMTCLTYLEGCEHRLAVISDHSHGVVNPREGALQIMLDRRTTLDDGKGMGEGLMDNVRTVSSFLVVLSSTDSETTDLLTLARKLTIPAVALTVRAEDLASGSQPGTTETTTGLSPPQEGGPSNALDLTEEPLPCNEATNTSAGNKACVLTMTSTTSETTAAASVECEKSYSDVLPTDQIIPLFVGDIAQGIRIVTLRALSDPSDWALLILHNTLNKTTIPFPSTSTFAFVDVRSIVETTLTGSIELEQFAVLSDIVLPPNALKTVKVLLKQCC